MRKTQLGVEWVLKDVFEEAYVCDNCHRVWIEDGETFSSAIKSKVRALYFAGRQ